MVSSVSMEQNKFEVTETACLHLAAGTGENASAKRPACRVHYPGVLPGRCVKRVLDLLIRIAQDMFYCTFNSILCSYGFSD